MKLMRFPLNVLKRNVDLRRSDTRTGATLNAPS